MVMSTDVSKFVQMQAEPEPIEIDLNRIALMIVDMQNSGLKKDGYFSLSGYDISPAQQTIKTTQKMIDTARSAEVKVIYIVTGHPADLSDSGGPDSPAWYKDTAVNIRREHPEWLDRFTIRGTWGAEIIDELKPEEGDIILEKMRYSAFFQTNLDTILKTFRLKYLIFTGVATNICVEATIRDAYYLSYFPILVSDATAQVGDYFLHEATIHNIKACYGWVTKSENALNAMKIKKSPTSI